MQQRKVAVTFLLLLFHGDDDDDDRQQRSRGYTIQLGCHERTARAERESALQGSGLVRTVGPCAQRRVALMPRAIATARDALSNDRRESTARFAGLRGLLSLQALALATEPRAKREARSIFVIPVSSPVATSEQSENVTIAVGARAIACYEGCGLCNNWYRFKIHAASICACALY